MECTNCSECHPLALECHVCATRHRNAPPSLNAPLAETCSNELCTDEHGQRTVLRWKCSIDGGCGRYNKNLKANDAAGQPNFQLRCHNWDEKRNAEGHKVRLYCHAPRPGAFSGPPNYILHTDHYSSFAHRSHTLTRALLSTTYSDHMHLPQAHGRMPSGCVKPRRRMGSWEDRAIRHASQTGVHSRRWSHFLTHSESTRSCTPRSCVERAARTSSRLSNSKSSSIGAFNCLVCHGARVLRLHFRAHERAITHSRNALRSARDTAFLPSALRSTLCTAFRSCTRSRPEGIAQKSNRC